MGFASFLELAEHKGLYPIPEDVDMVGWGIWLNSCPRVVC